MNVAFDRCIPILRNGKPEEESLMGAIISASEIGALLVPAAAEHALVNILSSATADALGLKTYDDVEGVFLKCHKDGFKPGTRKVIKDYFDRYAQTFELSSQPKKGHPFLQPCCPSYLDDEDCRINIAALADFFPSGNNKVHLFSTNTDFPGMTETQAFLALVEFQMFVPRSGKPACKREFKTLPHRSAPIWSLAGDYIPIGQNLVETILFNIDTSSRKNEYPKDNPSWAISDPGVPTKDGPGFRGPLHRATFPHHWIRLGQPDGGIIKFYVHPSSYSLTKELKARTLPTNIKVTVRSKGKSEDSAYRPRSDHWTRRHVLVQQSSDPDSATKKLEQSSPKRLDNARRLSDKAARDNEATEWPMIQASLFFGTHNRDRSLVLTTIEQQVDVPKACSDEMADMLSKMAASADQVRRELYFSIQSCYDDNAKAYANSLSTRFMDSLGMVFEAWYPSAIRAASSKDRNELLYRWYDKVRETALDMFTETIPESTKMADYYKSKSLLGYKLHKLLPRKGQ